MKNEANRLASFEGHWPESAPVQPIELARVGFYFIGPNDNVKCAYCGGGLFNWVPGDIAVGGHAWYYPECTFVHQLIKDEHNRRQVMDIMNHMMTEAFDQNGELGASIQWR